MYTRIMSYLSKSKALEPEQMAYLKEICPEKVVSDPAHLHNIFCLDLCCNPNFHNLSIDYL